MTLQQKLKWFGARIASVCTRAYHYTKAKNASVPYAVWAEDSEGDSFHADSCKAEQLISGSLNYFTKTEYDSVCDDIQAMLNDSTYYWYLSTVNYEPETGLIHYEWRWDIDGNKANS